MIAVCSGVFVPFDTIRQYADANTPIIPLLSNGDPDVKNIFTKQEIETLPSQVSEDLRELLYEKTDGSKKLKPLKLLAFQPLSPKEFWTDERIKRQTWCGVACQTGYIAGISAIVPGVDADSLKTRTILEKLIERFELSNTTIIQDTPHGGKHLLFKIPARSEEIESWCKRALYANLCKNDCPIEIKTNTMMITLAPSKHRREKDLAYAQRGITTLRELPTTFYDHLVSDLKSQGCIRDTPEEYHSRKENSARADFIPLEPDAQRYDLADSDMVPGINIILGRDDKDVGSAYVLHHRHDMVKSLGGYLFTWYITFESIKSFVLRLGTAAGDSSEDISNSLRKVEETWKRGINEQPIIGKSGLIEAFARLKEGYLSFGQERLALLTKALHLERNIPRRGGGKENDADVLVKIADREIPFFFMNHLNRACVVVKVQQHYEVVEINTDPF